MAYIIFDSEGHVQTALPLYYLQPPFLHDLMTSYFGLLLRAARVITRKGKKRSQSQPMSTKRRKKTRPDFKDARKEIEKNDVSINPDTNKLCFYFPG